TERVAVTVLRKRGSTPRTPLGSVRWVDLNHRKTAFFGFVRRVVEQAAERPCVELLCVRHAVADVGQVLERDGRTPVFDGFGDKRLRLAVQQVFDPAPLAATESVERVGGRL